MVVWLVMLITILVQVMENMFLQSKKTYAGLNPRYIINGAI